MSSIFSVSDTGNLAYQSGSFNTQLTWFDRTGKKLGTVGEPVGMNISLFLRMPTVRLRDSSMPMEETVMFGSMTSSVAHRHD
jgi:hypothetical protein